MKNFWNNFLWFWRRLWGRKYFIKYESHLKSDEILVKGHRIYINKEEK